MSCRFKPRFRECCLLVLAALAALTAGCGPNAFPTWPIDIHTRATPNEVAKIDTSLAALNVRRFDTPASDKLVSTEYGLMRVIGVYRLSSQDSLQVIVLAANEKPLIVVGVRDFNIYGTELQGESCLLFQAIKARLIEVYGEHLRTPYKQNC
jgi:hypothetical protein